MFNLLFTLKLIRLINNFINNVTKFDRTHDLSFKITDFYLHPPKSYFGSNMSLFIPGHSVFQNSLCNGKKQNKWHEEVYHCAANHKKRVATQYDVKSEF